MQPFHFFSLLACFCCLHQLCFSVQSALQLRTRGYTGRRQRNELRARLAVWQDQDGLRRAVHLARVNNYDGQQGKQQGELASN